MRYKKLDDNIGLRTGSSYTRGQKYLSRTESRNELEKGNKPFVCLGSLQMLCRSSRSSLPSIRTSDQNLLTAAIQILYLSKSIGGTKLFRYLLVIQASHQRREKHPARGGAEP